MGGPARGKRSRQAGGLDGLGSHAVVEKRCCDNCVQKKGALQVVLLCVYLPDPPFYGSKEGGVVVYRSSHHRLPALSGLGAKRGQVHPSGLGGTHGSGRQWTQGPEIATYMYGVKNVTAKQVCLL